MYHYGHTVYVSKFLYKITTINLIIGQLAFNLKKNIALKNKYQPRSFIYPHGNLKFKDQYAK